MANFWLKILISSSLLLICCCPFITGFYDQCTSSGTFGDSCDTNDDCDGLGLVCTLGKCQCHPDYYEKTDTKLSFTTKYCAKLPDRIGQSCQKSCKQPMFCNTGKCECIRSIVVDDICFSESALGQSCTRNSDCVLPFSTCQNNLCKCISGANQVGQKCHTVKNCPTGAKPGVPCVRTMNNKVVIQNHANSGAKSDNCSDDQQFCYTDDNSMFGHCCPVSCPLGSLPEKEFSCEFSDSASLSNSSKLCPEETHYCHRMAGQTFSTSVCCRKPCLDPEPLFIKGTCYERAFLNGACLIEEQCDGGYGMKCENHFCQCKPGFQPYSDKNTTGSNPAQICVRGCTGSNIAHNGECFKEKLGIQDQCVLDIQCPQGALCSRGRCLCDCSKGYTTVNKQTCAKPETRTVKPVEAITTSPNAFIDLIKSIFGSSGTTG